MLSIGAHSDRVSGMSGNNLRKLHQICEFTKMRGIAFIIAADWNRPPESMADLGIDEIMNGQLMWPRGVKAMCTSGEGEILDYGFASNCLVPFLTVGSNCEVTSKPHSALSIKLNVHSWNTRNHLPHMVCNNKH